MLFACSTTYRYSERFMTLRPLQVWLAECFLRIKALPSFLVPKYFAIVTRTAVAAIKEHACARLLSPQIGSGSEMMRSLAMCSMQVYGSVKSSSLHPTEAVPCLAAGLEHFSTDYMRCWGRDAFICLKGTLILTGRHAEAREHILYFGRTLKHGLIPNLLDSGRRPRYNCRDGVWFWLQSIIDFTEHVPEGLKILQEMVPRRFPLDDTYVEWDDPRCFAEATRLDDLIQEALTRHANGISYREWNAGPNLDHAMHEKGFDISIHTDWSTGFVMGGSAYNCGTWMDKMGDSEKAGNKGIPATPRDGAAIEITGMLKRTVDTLAKWSAAGIYRHAGVTVKGIQRAPRYPPGSPALKPSFTIR